MLISNVYWDSIKIDFKLELKSEAKGEKIVRILESKMWFILLEVAELTQVTW